MSTYQYKIFTPKDLLSSTQSDEVAGFLFHHLEQYGDEQVDIQKAIDYAMQIHQTPGGYVLVCKEGSELKGAVVVNRTGMTGYIPENILVYIAVHQSCRGQGVGKHLMQMALKFADGDMALHVEADNPAKFLYEKLGFENKYLEMRYKKPVNS